MSTQLPMNIPAVAKWYTDAEKHSDSDRCKNSYEECAGCRRLRDRMSALNVKYVSQLVEV